MKMSKPRSRVRRIKLILWIIHSVLYSRKPPKKKRKEYYIWRRHMWSKKSLARACYSYVHKPTFVSYVKNQRVPVSFFHQGEALEYIFVLLFHWLWILQIHEQESGMGFFLYIYIYICIVTNFWDERFTLNTERFIPGLWQRDRWSWGFYSSPVLDCKV